MGNHVLSEVEGIVAHAGWTKEMSRCVSPCHAAYG